MKKILCFGDSNTYGANPNWNPGLPSDSNVPMRWPADIRWTKRLQTLLGTEEYEIIEEGLCGRTTVFRDSIWPYCEGRTYFTPCVLSQLPMDLIVIMLGTNDLKTTNASGPDGAALAMNEFLKTACNPFLYSGFEIPKILLVSPVFIGDNLKNSPLSETFSDKSKETSRLLPKIYQNLAAQYGCEFMRASDFAEPSFADSIHMDETNHEKFAQGIAAKIKEILK